jgi:hypothetical protein
MTRHDPLASSPTCVVTLVDARVPSGPAQILAWNVVKQGRHDLSTFLCRSASGEYFLHCRPATRPTMPAAIVPLSPSRARAWFDAHTAHLADWDVLRRDTVL